MRMVGVWIYRSPRQPTDEVELTVGGTLLMNETEVQHGAAAVASWC
jgi:hypothetical protein